MRNEIQINFAAQLSGRPHVVFDLAGNDGNASCSRR
jgi:hypothetical protein